MLDDLWTERSADTLDRVLSVLSGTLARLDQCYPARWILGETRRDDRACGATAHDDEVEFLGHLGLPVRVGPFSARHSLVGEWCRARALPIKPRRRRETVSAPIPDLPDRRMGAAPIMQACSA